MTTSHSVDRDILVVGGGVAGLSGAVALARFGYDVEVLDAGHPRNATADGVHNLLGREGTAPLELTAAGRRELMGYGATVTAATVTGARRDGGLFTLTLADGQQRRAARLLVTSGVRDTLPDIPGLPERWGRDVLHCPFCHGFEVRRRAIGVIATSAAAVHQALLFRELSDDVIVFAHTADPFDDEQQRRLAVRGIQVVDGEVVRIDGSADRLRGVALADGRFVPREALVVAPASDATSTVLDELGVPHSRDGLGGYAHDAMDATPVPGVWIAGNVAEPFAPVAVAIANGFSAGGAIVADVMAEHVDTALAAQHPPA